jgi:SAM-dependent methyltransferase
MYEMLKKLATRPEPYYSMTIKELWTRPHIARQMLACHLDQDTHLASRPIAVIEEIIDWLDRELNLEGKRVCDLGCGPGLYSLRLAQRGADVIGVDFSPTAIAHAESRVSKSESQIEYRVADYLNDELPGGFDVVTLIYYDYCALSPVDRHALLRRIRTMLNPGGNLVLDVLTDSGFPQVSEQLFIEERLMDGFWSESDYVGIHRTWVYQDQALSLDHYAIVEPNEHWEILNWMQYFSSGTLVGELREAGYSVCSLNGTLAGEALSRESSEIGVIAETC